MGPKSIEEDILSPIDYKPLTQKIHINDMFSLWDSGREKIGHFLEAANSSIKIYG